MTYTDDFRETTGALSAAAGVAPEGRAATSSDDLLRELLAEVRLLRADVRRAIEVLELGLLESSL